MLTALQALDFVRGAAAIPLLPPALTALTLSNIGGMGELPSQVEAWRQEQPSVLGSSCL